jgi:beta-ureidopropionase
VFRSVFASAIAAGLHSVPHAGEMSGPATIWEVLDGLRAERIGHGISCLADPALVARLRESQIPLEVCPTSNVCTRQVAELAAHPLPRLLEEGLFVTLNSDDPPMFGTTLTDEYRQAATVLGLSRAQLADLAANGVRASFLEPDAKQALLAEISAVAPGSADGRRLPRTGGGDLVGIYKWLANTQVFPGAWRLTSRLAKGEDGALRGSTGGQDPMAEIVRAALIQQRWTGDKESMIAAAVNHIQTAASAGAQVACLQELFYGPYFCQVQDADYYSYTEAIPDGPTTKLLQDVARQHGIVIVAPMYEEEHPGIYYNTAAVIDADGSYLGKYRKTHIPQVKGFWEKFYFRPGNMGYPVFDTAAGRIGVYICYDRHFPEGWRALGLAGARIVFNPSATSRGLSQYLWRLEQPAAAVANEYFVGAINRVGIEPLGDNDFYGQTYFADPRGQLAGDAASDDKDEVLVRDLDMAQLAEVRNLWQFYRDRRPDQYESLVRP